MALQASPAARDCRQMSPLASLPAIALSRALSSLSAGSAEFCSGVVAPLAGGASDPGTAEWLATLRRSEIGRLLQPAGHGGRAVRTEEYVAAILGVAAVDASLGWLTAMLNAAAHDVAELPADTLVVASHQAGGRLSHDGRLTGRWESVVGAHYADWLLLRIDRDGGSARVLIPRSAAHVGPVRAQTGLSIDARRLFQNHRGRGAVVAGAGAVAAVVGSADGVWRTHVDQVRARLATSIGGHDVGDEPSAQVARAACDIDAAKLQITAAIQLDAGRAGRQAVARARDAADRLLASGRHPLDASEPVTRMWRDVHAGARIALRLLDELDSA